ncbi:MAG: carboxymuconolactone decarboxylase family protein [Terriglobia bacterium]
MARRLGVTEEELKALERGDLGCFGERERLALEFAGALTMDANRVSDDFFRKLRVCFDEGEVVEIAAVAGLFNYFNRVNNALQMEPTRK